MIDTLILLATFIALAGLAFAGSVRLGMLLGRRLDRFVEVQASAAGPDGLPAPMAPASSAPTSRIASEDVGQQEDRSV